MAETERVSTGTTLHDNDAAQQEKNGGKRELVEADVYELLGYSYPTWRKWQILVVLFLSEFDITCAR